MKKLAPALMLILLFSINLFAQTIDVKGLIARGFVKNGTLAQGLIVLTIPNQLHINSNKPSEEFLIPTEIKLQSSQIKKFKIYYPAGENKKFDFSERKLNVYEGKKLIRFSFFVPKRLKGKVIRIKANVIYQACSNEVCYAPQQKLIVLQAKVI